MKTSIGLLSAFTKNAQNNLFASDKKQIDHHAFMLDMLHSYMSVDNNCYISVSLKPLKVVAGK